MRPILLLLISGFLGAGKTSLLRNLLQESGDVAVGVIVNEFGSMGVDGKVIATKDIEMVEFNNGSIFCSCLKDRFVHALKTFSETEIDILIIENSGMADPASMNVILKGLAPYTKRPFQYQGAICVVDCTTFLDYADVLQAVVRQVETADVALLNKVDLVSKEELTQVRNAVLDMNPQLKLMETMFSCVTADVLLSTMENHGYQGTSSNTPQNRPRVYMCDCDQPISQQQLVEYATQISPLTLRLKGFAPCETGCYHIDCVCKAISVEPMALPEDVNGEIVKFVVIGQTDLAETLETLWHSITNTTLHVVEE